MINRRDAMKAGLGVLAALAGFELTEEKSKARGIMIPEPEYDNFLIEKGVLWSPGTQAMLFQDLVLSVTIGRPCQVTGKWPKPYYSMTISRVIGPLKPYCKLVHNWGTVDLREHTPMVVGVSREKGSDERLWFEIERPLLTGLGMTVGTKSGDGGTPMAIGEWFTFCGHEEPKERGRPTDEELKAGPEITDEEMKKYIPTWPDWSGFGLPVAA